MKCNICKNYHKKYLKYCPYCGKKIINNKMKIVYLFAGIAYACFIILLVFVMYNTFFPNINNVRTGDFVEEVISPTEDYSLKSYLLLGDPLSADAMRVELVNNKTKESRNIYFNYHENEVDMKWLDERTVKINNKILDIYEDEYDFREFFN